MPVRSTADRHDRPATEAEITSAVRDYLRLLEETTETSR